MKISILGGTHASVASMQALSEDISPAGRAPIRDEGIPTDDRMVEKV